MKPGRERTGTRGEVKQPPSTNSDARDRNTRDEVSTSHGEALADLP